jgi:uncharacterized membrane protein YkvA (DUF1232 family)
LRDWSARLKRDVLALWIAARDPLTPRAARWLAAVVAAYAISPIDLIPDFIPVLGYLDDLILVPLGIALAIRLIPLDLLDEFRRQATELATRPRSWIAMAAVIAVWLGCGLIGWRWLG